MAHSSPVFDTSTLGIILSARCGVCGVHSEQSLCTSCRSLVEGLSASQWLADRPGVPVLRALGRHEGALREAILAWKERGRADLTDQLARVVRPLIPRQAVIIPIPTRSSARRVRGECVIESLAQHLCSVNGRPMKRGSTYAASVSNCLVHRRKSEDQTDVSFQQRMLNVERTLAVKATALPTLARLVAKGHPVVVLDDIYTTGSTVREATRALHAVNIPVSLVVVIAAAGQDRWRSPAHRTSV